MSEQGAAAFEQMADAIDDGIRAVVRFIRRLGFGDNRWRLKSRN